MATEPRNSYEFSGALGGLVAADRELRVRQADRLAAEAQQITNSTNALNFNLAQKYKEKEWLGTLAKQKADLEDQSIKNNIARTTMPDVIAQKNAESRSAITTADNAQAVIDAGLAETTARTESYLANADKLRKTTDPKVQQLISQTKLQNTQQEIALAGYELTRTDMNAKLHAGFMERMHKMRELQQRTREADDQRRRWDAMSEEGKMSAEAQQMKAQADLEAQDIARKQHELERENKIAEHALAVAEALAASAAGGPNATGTHGIIPGADGKTMKIAEADTIMGGSPAMIGGMGADMVIRSHMDDGYNFREKLGNLNTSASAKLDKQYIINQGIRAATMLRNMYMQGRIKKMPSAHTAEILEGFLEYSIIGKDEADFYEVQKPEPAQVAADLQFRRVIANGVPPPEYIEQMTNEYAKQGWKMPPDMAMLAIVAAGGNVATMPGFDGNPGYDEQGNVVLPPSKPSMFRGGAFEESIGVSP